MPYPDYTLLNLIIYRLCCSNMADILPFKIPKPKDKHKGKTLCKSGFHKWQPVNENPFDTKQGKLISQYRCSRCGVTKNSAK